MGSGRMRAGRAKRYDDPGQAEIKMCKRCVKMCKKRCVCKNCVDRVDVMVVCRYLIVISEVEDVYYSDEF